MARAGTGKTSNPNKKARKRRDPRRQEFPGDVLKAPSKHPRYPWQVRWPGPEGRRMRKQFATETEALKWAKDRSEEVGKAGSDFGTVTEPERRALLRWRNFAAKYPGQTPDFLATVEDLVRRWEASRAGVQVTAAIDSFLEAKKAEGASEVHLTTLKARLGRVKADWGDRYLPAITTADVSDYLLTLRGTLRPAGTRGAPGKDGLLSLQTRRGYRLAMHSLFAWAKQRGMVTDNPVSDAAKPKPPPKIPGTLRPAQITDFFGALCKHAPALVPFWAVRVFAGIRESEALRLTWQMIDLAAGEINLPATITKTARPRTVAIEPALAAFLRLTTDRKGPLVTASTMSRTWHLNKALADLEGFSAPPNWARHSYATYHLLHFRHAGETALQLGHRGGPELLHSRYAGIATAEEAAEFWKIRPPKKRPPKNVLKMTAKKKAHAGKPARAPQAALPAAATKPAINL